jgi:Tfp pilus assembly protein PilP
MRRASFWITIFTALLVAANATDGLAQAAAQESQQQPASRRDPFDPLVSITQPGKSSMPQRLPPGKAGLVISLLRVDGIVKAPSGMIAVVSNQQDRVYFLREGDQLYDGIVERITLDAVVFRESGKDPFGRPIERQVTKRIYPSAGE